MYVEAGDGDAAEFEPGEGVLADCARGRGLEVAEAEALLCVAAAVVVLPARGDAEVAPAELKSSNGGLAGKKASFKASGDDAGEAAFTAARGV